MNINEVNEDIYGSSKADFISIDYIFLSVNRGKY